MQSRLQFFVFLSSFRSVVFITFFLISSHHPSFLHGQPQTRTPSSSPALPVPPKYLVCHFIQLHNIFIFLSRFPPHSWPLPAKLNAIPRDNLHLPATPPALTTSFSLPPPRPHAAPMSTASSSPRHSPRPPASAPPTTSTTRPPSINAPIPTRLASSWSVAHLRTTPELTRLRSATFRAQ